MTKRIFRAIFAVALAVFLAAMVLIMGVLYSYFTQLQHQQLRMQTALAAQAAAHEGASYFESLSIDGCRITWVDTDGTVLYDSDSSHTEMENHLQREEIIEALETGFGESTRYSSTLTELSIYTAQLLPDGTVLRLSVQHQSIVSLVLGMAQPICVIFTIAIVLSFILASRLSRHIVKPLNELNLDDPLSNPEYEELTPLLRRIDSRQKQLKLQAMELKHRQDEFDAITCNMQEGLILLGNKGEILTMNPAASKMLALPGSCMGKNILNVCGNRTIHELISLALTGQNGEKALSLAGRDYQISSSPVYSRGVLTGVALLLFDVTEKMMAESIRREFTANVSHELKTPLHSISGYAELLCSGIARPEDTRPFTEKIYNEAQRLIRLVEDIIRLSCLDEGAGEMKWEQTDLYILAQQAAANLSSAANLARISLEVEGTSAVIFGIPQLLAGLISNLCDNAIKYNRPQGSVKVTVSDGADFVTLCVKDTGIGIPEEHQSRVFERFYRVDKSHSKEVGGTGLGLSIVKHAAQFHHADIRLQSAPGKGTTVTVVFPTT